MFSEDKEYLMEKMEEQKQKVIKLISRHVGTGLADEFSKILVSAYEFGCPVAERLIDTFRLSQKDLLAIDDNFNAYEEQWIEDKRRDQSDYELDEAMGFYE